MAAIGVIGAGTWGTALSLLLCKNGCEVTVWSAIEEEITEMKEKRRHKNLAEVVLPEELRLTADFEGSHGGEGYSRACRSFRLYKSDGGPDEGVYPIRPDSNQCIQRNRGEQLKNHVSGN